MTFNRYKSFFNNLKTSIVLLLLFFISYTSLICFMNTSINDLEYLNEYKFAKKSMISFLIGFKLIKSKGDNFIKPSCKLTIDDIGSEDYNIKALNNNDKPSMAQVAGYLYYDFLVGQFEDNLTASEYGIEIPVSFPENLEKNISAYTTNIKNKIFTDNFIIYLIF